MTGLRSVGAASEASAEAVEVELLEIGKLAAAEIPFAEEAAHVVGLGVSVFHTLIVGAVGHQHAFVFAAELGFSDAAIVPHDDGPAVRLEDSLKLATGSCRVEPVERLTGGDEIHALFGEAGGLRGAIETHEIFVGGEE